MRTGEVEANLIDTKINPHQLVIEVTEGFLLEDGDEAGVIDFDGVALALTDGRTATERAWSERRDDLVLFGLVGTVIRELLRLGVRPDPEHPPEADELTERATVGTRLRGR